MCAALSMWYSPDYVWCCCVYKPLTKYQKLVYPSSVKVLDIPYFMFGYDAESCALRPCALQIPQTCNMSLLYIYSRLMTLNSVWLLHGGSKNCSNLKRKWSRFEAFMERGLWLDPAVRGKLEEDRLDWWESMMRWLGEETLNRAGREQVMWLKPTNQIQRVRRRMKEGDWSLLRSNCQASRYTSSSEPLIRSR